MDIPLLDVIDLDILMHRDVHFGGNFDIMIQYYEKEGIGVMPDFSLERIYELKQIQDVYEENLSGLVLPLPAMEEISRAKEMYHKLRDVYHNPGNEIPILISDLILTEEEEPEKEIHAILNKGKEAIDPLIHLIDSSFFYDPLFPGYGRAPMHAAFCLGKIRNPKAIPHLFHAMGQENFFVDESLIKALVDFGEKSKEFLLKRLMERPFTKDNEHAAIVLTSFPPEDEIAKIALELLQDENLRKHESFSAYLVCLCEGLKKESDRKEFLSLMLASHLTPLVQSEMKMVSKTWV